MVATTTITLNGNPYVARLPIRRYPVPIQTEAFRTTGAFLRTNNPKLEPYAFNDWSRGFGTRFIRPGHPEDHKGFYNAGSLLTIWGSAITYGLDKTDTGEIANNRLQASAVFQGGLWGLWVPDDDDADTDTVVARVATSGNWGGGGDVLVEAATFSKVRSFDLIVVESRLIAALGTSNDHIIRHSTDGVTWSAPSTTPPGLNEFASAAEMIADDDGLRLAYDGTRIVLAIHQTFGSNERISFDQSTNLGDTWTALTPIIGSAGGPTGLVAYLDTDDTTVIYVGTQEGVWLLDPAADTIQFILELPSATNNCRRMQVHNGSLYVPVDHGDDAPFGMKKITVRDGNRIIEDVGLDIAQEIPSEMLGSVTWMVSAGPWLFAAIGGGAANRRSRIIAITGVPGEGWQNVYRFATANDPISWIDTLGNDLHLQEGGATTTDPGDTSKLQNLFAPPYSGATFAYALANSDLELPEFGGDAPEEDGGFFQVQLDAADLVDAQDFIDYEYGLEGADPTTAGPRLDNTNRRQGLGTNNIGVSGRTIRNNLEFNGTSSTSPKFREFVLLFRKKPAFLQGYEFDIDLLATEHPGRSYEQIVTDLETVVDSQTLVTFKEYGQQTAINVEIPPGGFEFGDWLRAKSGQVAQGERGGLVRIKVEEVL